MAHDPSTRDTKTLLEISQEADDNEIEAEVKVSGESEAKVVTMETESVTNEVEEKESEKKEQKPEGNNHEDSIDEANTNEDKNRDAEQNVNDVRIAVEASDIETPNEMTHNHSEKRMDEHETENEDVDNEQTALIGEKVIVDKIPDHNDHDLDKEVEFDERIDDMTKR